MYTSLPETTPGLSRRESAPTTTSPRPTLTQQRYNLDYIIFYVYISGNVMGKEELSHFNKRKIVP